MSGAACVQWEGPPPHPRNNAALSNGLPFWWSEFGFCFFLNLGQSCTLALKVAQRARGPQILRLSFAIVYDSLAFWFSKSPSVRGVLKLHVCWLKFLISHFALQRRLQFRACRLRSLIESSTSWLSVGRDPFRFQLGCFSFWW